MKRSRFSAEQTIDVLKGHPTLKNSGLLENYCLPNGLKIQATPTSITTTTIATMRASATSRLRIPTSGVIPPSLQITDSLNISQRSSS